MAEQGRQDRHTWEPTRGRARPEATPELNGAVIDEADKPGLRGPAHIFEPEDAKGLIRAGIDAFAHGVRDRDIDDEPAATSSSARPGPHAQPPGSGREGRPWVAAGRPAARRARQARGGEHRPAGGAGRLRDPGAQPGQAERGGRAPDVGADGDRPGGLHEETLDMALAGMTPMQVIAAATRNSAEFLRRATRPRWEPASRRPPRARRQPLDYIATCGASRRCSCAAWPWTASCRPLRGARPARGSSTARRDAGAGPPGPGGRDFFCGSWSSARRAIDSLVLPAAARAAAVPEPMTAMAAVAARTTRLKFGPSVFTTPFRTPVTAACEIAMIDYLSNGRMPPAVGIGADQPREFEAAGVPFRERGRRTDEAILVMWRCWSEEEVTSRGSSGASTGSPSAEPVQQPMPLWIAATARRPCGGRAASATGGSRPSSRPAAPRRRGQDPGVRRRGRPRGARRPLRRALRLLPRPRSGRGPRAGGPLHPARARRRRHPRALHGVRPADLVRERLEEYVAGGASKFILRPMCPPDRMLDQLAALATEVVPAFHRREG